MTYESWRISYQSDEQSARAAFKEVELLRSDLVLARRTIDALQAAYRIRVRADRAEEKAHHALQIGWLRAIDVAMAVSHLGIANANDSYDVAKQKLNDLIGFHTDVATDPAVNGGFKLVPVEPTSEMLDAGEATFISTYTGTPTSSPGEVWAAMIAAIPETKP